MILMDCVLTHEKKKKKKKKKKTEWDPRFALDTYFFNSFFVIMQAKI